MAFLSFRRWIVFLPPEQFFLRQLLDQLQNLREGRAVNALPCLDVPNPNDGFGNGNGTFNTPTLIEAADTGPFFHNNSIETIEEAVNFYNSNAFNASPAGLFLASTDIVGIDLETTQVVAVAAFLRVINALENIRSGDETASFTLGVKAASTARDLLKLTIEEVNDAIDVLDGAGLHPDAVNSLKDAVASLEKGITIPGKAGRNMRINEALVFMQAARDDMVM